MRDPYQVLGTSKTASAQEIKSAYRKLAKQLHPDANAHDPKAKDRFAELTSAYDLLSDEKKRKQFDAGEIDAAGNPRFHGFDGFSQGARTGRGGFSGNPNAETIFEHLNIDPSMFRRGQQRQTRAGAGGFAGFEDLFGDVMGQFRNARNAEAEAQPSLLDVNLAITVPFRLWARGGKHEVALPNGKRVSVAITPGVAADRKIRLKGQGMNGPQGSVGDVYLTVSPAVDPLFSADGQDVRARIPIRLDEAVLGATVRVPTLDGPVDLRIPPMTSSGRSFRLRGKGLPAGEDQYGDLYITVEIVLPPGSDKALDATMERLRDAGLPDPRAGLE